MTTQTVLLAAGCFWGVQHRLGVVPGVRSTCAGYARAAGSDAPEAECVRVGFDPLRLPFADLLAAFFAPHDPTRVRPPKYRSAVFATTPEQLEAARGFVAGLQDGRDRPVLTEIGLAGAFRAADERHQNWMEKRAMRTAAIATTPRSDHDTSVPP